MQGIFLVLPGLLSQVKYSTDGQEDLLRVTGNLVIREKIDLIKKVS